MAVLVESVGKLDNLTKPYSVVYCTCTVTLTFMAEYDVPGVR